MKDIRVAPVQLQHTPGDKPANLGKLRAFVEQAAARMGAIDPSLWERRREDPAAIEAELRGPKGRGGLMRWLPSRAHDNGMFLIFSNGVGTDDDEVRTGNAMVLDPYGEVLVETGKADDDMVVVDFDAEVLPTSSGRRWLTARRPELYKPLCVPTGRERDTRSVRFDG